MTTKTRKMTQEKSKRFFLLLIIVFNLAWLPEVKAQSELGVVWAREYDNIPAGLKGSPQGLDAQPLYYKATGKIRYLLTGTEDYRRGFIAMLDESGNVLKYWSVPIPSYYDKYPVESVATRAAKINVSPAIDYEFCTARTKVWFGTDNPQDILASIISTAVMKADGSILAFGQVLRYKSDKWKADGDSETDFSPGSHADSRMKQGVWKITISADGQTVTSETARGAQSIQTFLYDDKVLVAGLDIHTKDKIGAAGGEGVGMLHEYTLDGTFVAERCPNAKDGDAIIGASKYPNGDILLWGWQSVAMKINPNNPNVSLGTYTAGTVSGKAQNMPMEGTPAIDGGAFFNPQFSNTGSVRTGATFAKLKSDGKLAYKIYDNGSSRNIVYSNPLILNMDENKYVGTVEKNGINYIYELKDKGTSYELTEGDPYPNNTSLRTVSLQDGFFSMGYDPVTRKTSIAKLSPCANFKLDVGGSQDVVMLSGQTFPSRTFRPSGNKGVVSYQWTLTDISAGGSAIGNWAGINKSGTSNILPAQTFQLSGGKDFAELQYTVSAIDNYDVSGVPQSCQQSYTVRVRIFRTLPDNIIVSPSSCLVPFEKIDFKVKEKWSKAGQGHQNTGVLVGDLDGDGQAEVIGYSPAITAINIYNGTNGTTKATISLSAAATGTGGWHPTMTAAMVDADRNGMGEVIVANPNKTLASYEADTTGGTFKMVVKWPLSGTVTFENPTTNDNLPQPIVVDLNGDGTPELIVYNKIYNAATGAYLGQTEPIASAYVGRVPERISNKATNFLTTADFDGDGLPEIVAGGKIYKVVFAGDKSSVICSPLYVNEAISDGFTAVADIDMDGMPDVVAVNVVSGATWLRVWSPLDGRMIDEVWVYTDTSYPAQSYPFVGDIDGVVDPLTGEKHPEICLTIRNKVLAYKYDSSTGKMLKKWELKTSDNSGGTGITLFDFNNDGINELVYRDQELLRILDGRADTTEPVLSDAGASISCVSGTAFEYPVIADVDGDGSANICVTCAVGSSNYLRVYESGSQPWSPTRQVWNQVNYEPTQINNDLTVPAISIPKNTQFEVNGVKYSPYNGALIQVPISSINMTPVLEAPDPFVIDLNGVLENDTTVRISVVIANQGKKYVNSSLPVSLYGSQTYDPSALLVTKPINTVLAPGSTVEVELITTHIKNLAAHYSVRLQDEGAAYPAPGSYMDCNMDNNELGLAGIFAHDDRLLAFMNRANTMRVLDNDVVSLSCAIPSVLIQEHPKHGMAITKGATIEYTPHTDYMGRDTLMYLVSCGAGTAAAYANINVVPQPDNISEADCYVDPEAKTFTIKEYLTFTNVHTMSTPLVADLDGTGPKIVSPRMASGYSIVYQPWMSTGLVIADVKSKTQREINTVTFATHGQSVAIGDVDKDGLCEIFIQDGTTSKIYCYNPDGTLKSSFTTTVALGEHFIIQLADLNCDGQPELIAGPYIFQAATGQLLLKMTFETDGKGYGNPHGKLQAEQIAYGGYYYMPAIGDVDGDGYLEIVGGSTVYKPNTTFSGYTTKKVDTTDMPADFMTWLDGPTVLVDFDLDGQLDVCVVGHQKVAVNGSSPFQFYVWNPVSRKVITYAPQHLNNSSGTFGNPTIPYVGDIDGNGYPDLSFAITGTGSDGMISYQYDKTQVGNIKKGPSMPAFAETSGFTMFDFNQDGKSEIIYRGVSDFYIVGIKEDKTGYVELSPKTQAWSGTVAEYPIVADVDDDGQAEIILTRAYQKWTGTTMAGVVAVYKASDTSQPWASARPVWNQWSYNSVNINDDMTIPQYQTNPATVYPGKDGQLGTADDVRPFNGFLLQQTSISREGVPLFLASNVQIANSGDIRYAYDSESDKLTISHLQLTNLGDASLSAPIMVAVYNRMVASTNLIGVHREETSIAKGDMISLTMVIEDFGQYIPTDNLIIHINDDGQRVA